MSKRGSFRQKRTHFTSCLLPFGYASVCQEWAVIYVNIQTFLKVFRSHEMLPKHAICTGCFAWIIAINCICFNSIGNKYQSKLLIKLPISSNASLIRWHSSQLINWTAIAHIVAKDVSNISTVLHSSRWSWKKKLKWKLDFNEQRTFNTITELIRCESEALYCIMKTHCMKWWPWHLVGMLLKYPE